MSNQPKGFYDAKSNFRRKEILRSPFGEYLAGLREERRLQLTVLARKAGLKWSGHPWSIEAGRCHPNRDTVEALAKALNVDADEMWEKRNESKKLWQDQKRIPLSPKEKNELEKDRTTNHATVYLTHDEYLYCNEIALNNRQSLTSVIRGIVREKMNAET